MNVNNTSQYPGENRRSQQQQDEVGTTASATATATSTNIEVPTSIAQQQQQSNNNTNRNLDNSVLYAVLEELDRERSKRAALETELRKLRAIEEEEERLQKQLSPYEIQYQSYESERNTCKELVDAITSNLSSPYAAILKRTNKAKNNNEKKRDDMEEEKSSSPSNTAVIESLPIHVIRMLEVMPYDPRAIKSTKAKEEVRKREEKEKKQRQIYILLMLFPLFFSRIM